MFKNAKIGDRVWDFRRGWGTIKQIDFNTKYPLKVVFDEYDGDETFNIEGKEYNNLKPTLFWDEIKFEIPKKPLGLEDELKKLEIKEFKLGKNNCFLTWNNQFECITKYPLNYLQNPFLICFTEESINNFMDNIKDKEITKKQFFTAYRNVFGGIMNE